MDLQEMGIPARASSVRSLASMHFLWTRSQNCEKRLLASPCLSVCLSVRIEQLSSHLTGFHEILYLGIFGKSVQKIQFS